MKLSKHWDIEVNSDESFFQLKLKEIIQFKDLLFILIHRDFVTYYKQTVLGPIWYILQPLITTLTFTIIFGKMAQISTDGIPEVLFYLSGITFWGYFSESFQKVSLTFRDNQSLYGKVYFPRLISPLSVVFSNAIKLAIQFFIFLAFYFYFLIFKIDPTWTATSYLLFLPVIVLLLALLSIGLGIIISSLTIKYRDLHFLIGFGVQLLMYVTPIIYPLSSVPEKYKALLYLNPVTPLIECVRMGFFGKGIVTIESMTFSAVYILCIFFFGVVYFNKSQRTFMDTI